VGEVRHAYAWDVSDRLVKAEQQERVGGVWQTAATVF
jgi:hypothetical protein